MRHAEILAMLDSIGIMGNVMHHSLIVALVGSAALLFFYFWRRGRLDMDETASQRMMEWDDLRSEWRTDNDERKP